MLSWIYWALKSVLNSLANVLNSGVEDLINLAERQSEPPKEFPPIHIRDTVSEVPDDRDDKIDIEIDNKDTVSEMNVKSTGEGWIKRNLKRICVFFKPGKKISNEKSHEMKPIYHQREINIWYLIFIMNYD